AVPPCREHAVERLGADQRLLGRRQLRREEQERPCLGAAESAVERDQLLEGAALVKSRVVEAADEQVRRVRETVCAEKMPRRRGREPRQRVLSLHAVLLEVADAAAAS